MESEAVLRATFADAGSTAALLAALRSLRAHGEALRQQLGDQAADYLATGGPFPERLHLIALTGRFLSDYAELLEGWATWAEDTVADWPATGPASAVPVPTEVFDLVLRRARRPPPDLDTTAHHHLRQPPLTRNLTEPAIRTSPRSAQPGIWSRLSRVGLPRRPHPNRPSLLGTDASRLLDTTSSQLGKTMLHAVGTGKTACGQRLWTTVVTCPAGSGRPLRTP
jgi:hypothetical protein